MGNIENAITVLEEHIVAIQTVPEWAERMGYESPKYFTRKVRAHYKKSPYKLIVEKKLERIRSELENSGNEIIFSIALDLGFADHNALYKFVKRHTGKTPSELRKRRVKKESEKGE
jgi:AraC-like DNA-binding protein